jgi:hypothetical protein
MIYFALTLFLCAQALGCHWIMVDEYTSEEECVAAGRQWTAEGGEIKDWKCVIRIREDKTEPKRKQK